MQCPNIAIVAILTVCCITPLSGVQSIKRPVKLPEYIKVCKRNDVKLNECVKENAQHLLSYLRMGIPEVGVMSMEPFIEPEVKLDYARKQVNIKALFRNVGTMGLSTMKILDARVQLTDNAMNLEVDTYSPEVILETTFTVDARVGAVFVKNKGYINVTMIGVNSTITLLGDVEKHGAENYINLKRFSMKPVLQDLKIYITDLLPGNTEFNTFVTNYLNNEWRYVYKELLPVADEYWNLSVRRHLNNLFLKVPYNVLFPKD